MVDRLNNYIWNKYAPKIDGAYEFFLKAENSHLVINQKYPDDKEGRTKFVDQGSNKYYYKSYRVHEIMQKYQKRILKEIIQDIKDTK